MNKEHHPQQHTHKRKAAEIDGAETNADADSVISVKFGQHFIKCKI